MEVVLMKRAARVGEQRLVQQWEMVWAGWQVRVECREGKACWNTSVERAAREAQVMKLLVLMRECDWVLVARTVKQMLIWMLSDMHF